MSPTWMTSTTSGSALIEAMNAGVALNSAVSVGLVPYGASPYTATVNGAATSEAPAPGAGIAAATAAASPAATMTPLRILGLPFDELVRGMAPITPELHVRPP